MADDRLSARRVALVGDLTGRSLAAVIVMALPAFAVAVWIAFFWPVPPNLPYYLELAAYLGHGHAQGDLVPHVAKQLGHDVSGIGFVPLGYSALISGWVGGNVDLTLRIVHFASLLATWAIVGWTVLSVARRYGYRSLQAPRKQEVWIVFWLAVILFNPYFLADLARVNDSAVNILFIAVLMACALGARHATATSWILAGVTLAAFTMVRPNAITLILALFAVAWLARAPSMVPTMAPIWGPVVLTVSTAVAFVAFCLLAAGKPFLWPANGGYNLFAGNNPFALAQLVIDHNAEYSLPQGLVWCGSADGKLHELDYTQCTIRFVAENPGEFLRLLAYKAFSLFFRPNLRLADTPLKVAAQYAIMAPAVAWWAAFVVSRSFRLSLPGRVGLLFLLLYGAPFVLTNVDQRFRIPFDVIYAMSALAFACGDRAPTFFRPLFKAPRQSALTSL